VGAENRYGAVGNLIQRLDENRTHTFKPFNYMTVMYDFVSDIDRSAEFFEGPFNDLDCTYDSRAKTPRLSHKNAHTDHLLRRGAAIIRIRQLLPEAH